MYLTISDTVNTPCKVYFIFEVLLEPTGRVLKGCKTKLHTLKSNGTINHCVSL